MKFFSFSKNHLAVVSTLMTIVFLGVCYFYIYIPANESSIQKQRFRSLQNIDNNIHAKLDNSISYLNNLLHAYHINDDKYDSTRVSGYIRSYSKRDFTLKPIVSLPKNNADDSIASLKIDSVSNSFDVVLQKKYDRQTLQIKMRYTVGQFIKFLLPATVFDEYVIFHNGKVIYQTFASGINYSDKDSLLRFKNGISGADVRIIKAGGNDYHCFLQPVKISEDQEWIIAGMLTNQRYIQEKKQLPTGIMLLILTLGLAMVMAFPWIKLYQMGNQDRLTVTDGVSTIVVSMLLMSLVYFAFVKYNHGFEPSDNKYSKILAHKIDSALNTELEIAAKLLMKLDTIQHEKVNGLTISNLYTDSVRHAAGRNTRVKTIDSTTFSPYHSTLKMLNIREVFWLDDKGSEKISWITSSINSPPLELGHRDYFKRVKEGKENFRNSKNQMFYLDQVISFTTSVFTSVLSAKLDRPGDTKKVVALSLNFRSLDNVVMPLGFYFSIINESGKVLYHSQSSRNLNENLLTEFSESDELSSCLASQSSGSFTTNYFSKEYNVYVNRMSRLPYSMVILEDNSYHDTRDMEVYSFTISMLLCWSLFLAFELIIIFLASAKRSFLKKQLFDTSWIGPKKSSKPEYKLCILCNCVIIILLIVFYTFSFFLDYLLMLLSAVSFIGIFLNIVFLRKYKRENKQSYFKYKTTAIYALSAFIGLKNIIAYKLLDTPQFLLLNLFQLSCIAAFALIFYYEKSIISKFRKRRPDFLNLNFSRSFTLMIVTRLVVTSGIPVAFFYIASYNYEHNLSTRYRQVHFVNQLSDKISDVSFGKTGIYTDSAYVKSIEYNSPAPAVKYSKQDSVTFKLFSAFRMRLSTAAIQMNNFYLPVANGSLTYNNLLKTNPEKSGSITHKKIDGQNSIEISSANMNYVFPLFNIHQAITWQALLFWFLFVVAHVLFSIILHNIIKKLFSINLPLHTGWSAVDDVLLANKEINKLLFMIGSPGSGKLSMLLDKIQNKKLCGKDGAKLIYDKNNPEKSNVLIADMILIPETEEDAKTNTDWLELKKNICNEVYKLIIINHFEYNIKNADTNHIKLDLLETLLQKNQAGIIVVSTVHPVSFLDSYHSHLLKPEETLVSAEDLERWHVLLGHFRIIVQPIENSENKNLPRKNSKDMANLHEWETSLQSETNYSHFLYKMQRPVISALKNSINDKRYAIDSDSIIFKLQISSHYFYMYIWQSLTKEEKFLLYDLAEDGLVNPFDDYNLTMLISKGIIIRDDGTLKLFNKGFRNFILTAIGNTEAMKIKNEIRDNGNWSKMRGPLIIVILAIFAFLLASQQETYSKLVTYVTALAAGVPTLMKLFSIFDKNAQKAE